MTVYTLELTEDEIIEDFEEVDLLIDAEDLLEMPIEVPRDWDHQWLINRDAQDAHPMSAITGLVNTLAKLDTIEAGAQVNIIEGVSVNGVTLTPSAKVVNVEVPTRYGVTLTLDEKGRIFLKDPFGDTLSHVDTELERIIKSGYYDEDTQEIVLVTDDDTEVRIPASGLVDIYTADEDTLTVLDKVFSMSPTSKETLLNSIRHIADKTNPHAVTKAQVGLGNCDNTADLNKPISTATQTALDAKAALSDFNSHVSDYSNPHRVTKAQVGLGNCDDTSDANKPISTATQEALDAKADRIPTESHIASRENPHQVTAAQVGLGNVDNTADMDKPISTATQEALDAKQATVTGAATSILAEDLAPSMAVVSDAQGKVATSTASADEVARLKGVTSPIQTQIDSKQPTITGAATSITVNDLDAGKILKADGLGKVAPTGVDASKLLYIDGLEKNVLDLLAEKVDKVSGMGLSTNDYTNAEKSKLSGIETGAQVNVLETVKVNGEALTSTDKAVDVTVPTKVSQIENDTGFITKAVADLANYYVKSETYTRAEVQGLIAAIPLFSVTTVDALPAEGDPLKIYFVPKEGSTTDAHDEFIWVDGAWELIGTTAFVLTIDQGSSGISINGTALQGASSAQPGLMTPDHIALIGTKADASALSGYVPVSRMVNGHALTGNIEITAGDVGALPDDTYIPPEIIVDEVMTATSPNPVSSRGIYQAIIDAGESITVAAHVSDKSNPHDVTKAQVGLGNCDDTSDLDKPISTATQTALDGKVDKVSGKGLSTEDYTTAEKTKLAGIASGAQVNVLEGVKVNGTALVPVSKVVDITVPTDTADLTNGADYATMAEVTSAVSPKADASDLTAHTSRTDNPHGVTKAQLGLGNVDNTSDLSKPISTATQSALDLKATAADLTAHTTNKSNPHEVTAAQVGLGNVDNTADADKPVSTAQQTALNLKVDKVTGKGLSTEDFTSALKTKLSELYTKAQIDELISAIPKYAVVKVDALPTSDISTTTIYLVPKTGTGSDVHDEYLYINGSWELIGTTAFNLEITQGSSGISINGTALQSASTSVPGLMTSAQVTTLNGAATASALSAHTSDVANPHQVTKAQVGLGNCDNTSDANKPISTATQAALDLKAAAADLTSHTGNTSNPHGVTKAQVGLGNCDNTSDADKPISTATQSALDLKVDKVTGKGLSTEDYTTTEKTKLSGIASGAQVNVIETVQVNGSALTPSSKVVNIDLSGYVPTTRTVNGKALSANISLTYSDVGALASSGTAAKATADANGNNIVNTYATQTAVAAKAGFYRGTVTGDGSTKTWTLTHGLGGIPLTQIYDASGNLLMTDVVCTTTTIKLTFNTAPSSGTNYTVVCIG
ncbi:MAG: hypothetical protein ACI381_06660 [Candidatus Methanomethylophilaceae archaeon]